MSFQGELKDLPLPDVVQLIDSSSKTGKLACKVQVGTADPKNPKIDSGFLFLRWLRQKRPRKHCSMIHFRTEQSGVMSARGTA